MNRNLTMMLVCALAVGGCAGDVTETSESQIDDNLALGGGKADGGDDIVIQAVRGGSLVTMYGPAAAGLWNILEDAGYGVSFTRSGLELIRTGYIACVTNRSAAACQLFSRDTSEVEGFDLAIHGQRFRSASSELFGAIAAVNGVSPASVTSLENGIYRCERDTRNVWCGVRNQNDTVTLQVSLSGLGDLGPDYVYEGWLITSAGPVTAGRFGLDSADQTVEIEVDRAIADDSTMYILTIEPTLFDDPAPSDTHVVAGVFGADGASLDTAHPGAIGTDFTDAVGGYILETPSSAETSDYNQGIWFVDPAAGAASLALPTLPAGWVYEGWVVDADGPVSTGTFLSTDGADSDGGGPAAGPNGTPPFPGQDFIDPARDLIGNTVVISVEPSPDNSPAPFFLKPLVDGEADDVGPAVIQDMGNNAEATAVFGHAAFL